jgi:hypothetical protein
VEFVIKDGKAVELMGLRDNGERDSSPLSCAPPFLVTTTSAPRRSLAIASDERMRIETKKRKVKLFFIYSSPGGLSLSWMGNSALEERCQETVKKMKKTGFDQGAGRRGASKSSSPAKTIAASADRIAL